MYKNINELIQDEDLLVSLVEAENAEDFGAILEEKEIQLDGISKEEAFSIFKAQKEAELTEEDLMNASGGIALTTAVGCVAAFALAGAELSFIGGYAYQKYFAKKKK